MFAVRVQHGCQTLHGSGLDEFAGVGPFTQNALLAVGQHSTHVAQDSVFQFVDAEVAEVPLEHAIDSLHHRLDGTQVVDDTFCNARIVAQVLVRKVLQQGFYKFHRIAEAGHRRQLPFHRVFDPLHLLQAGHNLPHGRHDGVGCLSHGLRERHDGTLDEGGHRLGAIVESRNILDKYVHAVGKVQDLVQRRLWGKDEVCHVVHGFPRQLLHQRYHIEPGTRSTQDSVRHVCC